MARGSRHDARRAALVILYEADLKERPIAGVLAQHMGSDEPPVDFTVALVRGVNRHQVQIDALIRGHAHGWQLERMPVIDRNLLRMALFEIIHDPEVPAAVAIDEAVELAKEFSTDDSSRFVNGVLSRIAAETAPDAPETAHDAPDA